MEEPGLYGIKNSNRTKEEFWGKNQFNSSFPAALACFMRDKSIPARFIKLGEALDLCVTEIHMDKVFASSAPNGVLHFLFEQKLDGFEDVARSPLRGVDLVVAEPRGGEIITTAALEVKLTVVPDQTTCQLKEEDWAPEIVLRPVSTKLATLRMMQMLEHHKPEIAQQFRDPCEDVQSWSNRVEMLSISEKIIECLEQFQTSFLEHQTPCLMQPIWKTQAKRPEFAPDALDLFVWSDHAIFRAIIDRAKRELNSSKPKITRYLRASLRLARALYELSSSGRVDLDRIYTEMEFKLQTDKECAFSGKQLRQLIPDAPYSQPRISVDALREIILGNGYEHLSPERRFDASIYFTARKLFQT